MGKRTRKRATYDEADGYNPLKHTFWAEGEEGRKAGSKVPAAKRKAKRRRRKNHG
jgi:hypothetical protein